MRKYLFYAVCLSGALSSCNDVSNLYDEEYVKSLSPFSQYQFDENFDWNMTHDVIITVKVADAFDGKYWYGVEVFEENPVLNPEARLLAKGSAKQGDDFVTSLSMAKTTNRIYVRQTTPENLVSTMALDIDGDTALLDFSGNATRATRAAFTRAETRVTKPNIPMPSGEAYYPTSIPAGAVEMTDNSSNSQLIKITEDGTEGRINVNQATLYITAENVKITGAGDLSSTKIYLLPGASVTFSQEFNNLKGGTVVTIAEGATAVFEQSNMNMENGAILANKGSMKLQSYIKVNSSGFYNEGTLTCGKIAVTGNDGKVVNSGTITAMGDFAYEGGGTFYNQSGGNVNLGGNLEVTGNNCYFYNDGALECLNFRYYGNSAQNYTGCKLTVRANMTVDGQSALYVEAGSMVKTRNLYMQNDDAIYLFDESYLLVEGKTQMDNIRSNGCGIVGKGTKMALARLGDLVLNNNYQNQMCGPLYCIVKSVNKTDFETENTVVFSNETETEKNANIIIPKVGECNDGYEPKKKDPEDVENRYEVSYSAIYAFEDNYPSYGDYDMNDVVVKLDITGYSYSNSTQTTTKLSQVEVSASLLANGCFFQNAVYVQLLGFKASECDNTVKNENPGMVIKLCDDVVRANGGLSYFRVDEKRNDYSAVTLVDKKVYDIEPVDPTALTDKNVNFFITTKKSANQVSPIEIHMKDYPWSGNLECSRIYLMAGEVDARRNANSIGNDVTKAYIYQTQNGEPWGLRFPGNYNWNWPDEKVRINTVYPNFVEWATSGGAISEGWYTYPVSLN